MPQLGFCLSLSLFGCERCCKTTCTVEVWSSHCTPGQKITLSRLVVFTSTSSTACQRHHFVLKQFYLGCLDGILFLLIMVPCATVMALFWICWEFRKGKNNLHYCTTHILYICILCIISMSVHLMLLIYVVGYLVKCIVSSLHLQKCSRYSKFGTDVLICSTFIVCSHFSPQVFFHYWFRINKLCNTLWIIQTSHHMRKPHIFYSIQSFFLIHRFITK